MSSAPACLICYSKSQPLVSTPCNHNEICAICYVRLRALDERMECPVCKSVNEQVVVAEGRTPPLPFEEYHIWGDQLGENYHYHEGSGMFFPINYYEDTIAALFRYNCHLCKEDNEFPSYKKMQDHLRVEHRLALCDLCVDNKRDFVARLPRFSPSGLHKHQQHPSHGHAKCKFCKPLFYDASVLYQHLRREHYECHLCHSFFRNYDQLHRHFEGYHFSCRDPACIAARFVAFGTELDLIHHQRNVHGVTTAPSISLNFKSSRRHTTENEDNANGEADSGIDPTGFTPPSIIRNTQNENDEAGALHPEHVRRTEELRQQAALLREQESDPVSVEVFPTLGPASTASTNGDRISIGWSDSLTARARGGVGNVSREEAFPSLPTSTAPKRKPVVQRRQPHQPANVRNANNWKSSKPVSQFTSASLPGHAASAPSLSQTESFPALGGGGGGWGKPKGSVQRTATAPSMTKSNFPALGPGTKKTPASRYTAAESLAKKLQQKPPAAVHQNNFLQPPPMRKAAGTAKKAWKPPNTNSTAQFPTLDRSAPAAHGSAAAASGSLDNIKAELGASDYKTLKNLTKDYSKGVLAPEDYVDRAFSLLDGGDSFFRFVPALVASCPSVNPAMAQSYIRELRVQSKK